MSDSDEYCGDPRCPICDPPPEFCGARWGKVVCQMPPHPDDEMHQLWNGTHVTLWSGTPDGRLKTVSLRPRRFIDHPDDGWKEVPHHG